MTKQTPGRILAYKIAGIEVEPGAGDSDVVDVAVAGRKKNKTTCSVGERRVEWSQNCAGVWWISLTLPH